MFSRVLALSLFPLLLAACSGGGSSDSLGLLRDSDGDGLPDRLERTLGSDPRDADEPYVEGADDDDTPSGPGIDAIRDGLEHYLREHGARAPITARTDTDGDGIPDALEVASGLDPFDTNDPVPNGSGDLENDGGPALDGISDALESYLLRRGARAPLTAASDSDADGLPDTLEVVSGSDPFDALDPPYGRAFDLDHDGVCDALEIATGSDPLNADFPTFDGADDDDGGELGPDGDGVTDGLEGWLVRHGATAPLTTVSDTDGDGAPDVAEVRAGFDPFDARSPLADGARDSDGDGIADSLEILLVRKGARAVTRTSDTDGDRIADFAELASGSNPFDRSDPQLFSHFDLDGDGLEDFLELERGSDPLDPDSPLVGGALDRDDATGPGPDPISDALEALMIAEGTAAPVTLYSDSDGDGLSDFVELRLVSDPFDPDSPRRAGASDEDGDGISDAAEQVLLALGVSDADPGLNSDGDIIPDVIELQTGSNPLDSSSPRPFRGADTDGDGALDSLELMLGFDPRSSDDPVLAGGTDSDGDGLSDALEELLRLTSTSEPITPLSDSDGDGLYDYLEIELASDRHDGDRPVVGGNLVAGGVDRDDHSGPAGDGISDALEFFLIAGGAQAPVTRRSDTDRDAVPDSLELRLALDPFDASSPVANGTGDDDGDGVSNALEFVLAGLGAPTPVDGRTDSDADGAPDHLEVFAGADAFDADVPVEGGARDTDGDGLSDALESVLLALGARAPLTAQSDTDKDGITDLYEVRSGTHPLRGDHPLVNGGADVLDASGPRDSISDGLEALLITQGALAPVTHATDSDADGAPDHLEVRAGSGPFERDDPLVGGAADDDQDHMSAALEEVLVRLGATPPLGLRSDTDGDGAPDYFEVERGAHPVDADIPIAGGAGANRDSNADTGPNDDNISDALEFLLIRLGCRGPIFTDGDTDTDGLPDWFEVYAGTNALDGDSPLANGGADTDNSTGPGGDLISDALEVALIAQGAHGPITLTTDSDGDGVPDFYEIFKGSDPFDASDEIAPGTRPEVLDLALSGFAFGIRTLTGSYRYSDAERDPEGATAVRWLRDGVPIAGETSLEHLVVSADLGTTLAFEVTPVSLYAYPPETAQGLAHPITRFIPGPAHGDGGPGGVGVANATGDVRLWLRGGRGLTLGSGDKVDAWQDASGHGHDALAVETDKRPTRVTGVGPRAATVVRFDGASHLNLSPPVQDDFTLVAAFATTSTVSNGTWYVSPAILGGENPLCRLDYHLGINGGKGLVVVQDTQVESTRAYADGLPHEIVGTRDQASGRVNLFTDGARRSAVAGTSSLTCTTSLYVGSSTLTDGFWNGDLFEVVAYDHALSELERDLVETYFSAGIGAPDSLGLYAFAGTHAGDVAGIGRLSATDFLTSAEGPGVVRVSAPSALSDGDFLVWGVDVPTDFALSEDVPAPFARRMLRTWAVSLTDGGAGDGVGTVDVRFRVGGLLLTSDVSDFALLQDDDTHFADALVVPGFGFYDGATETIEFRNIDLAAHRYFTLAVRPLP